MSLRDTDPVALLALVVSAGTTSYWTWRTLSGVDPLDLLVVSVPALVLSGWSLRRARPRGGGRPLAQVALAVGLLPAVAVSCLLLVVVALTLLGLGMLAD